jgi:hypothetical protein
LSKATVSRGAYGLQLIGLRSSALVEPVPESWTPVRVERRALEEGAPDATRIEDELAELVFLNGWSLRIDRQDRSATFFVPPAVDDDELVHPYLTPLAEHIAAEADGRALFHGGAFVAGGGAWGVFAGRMGGKSTTLGRLAQLEVAVLTDDVLVLDGEEALAGPRCIDLRPDAAEHLAERSPEVRSGERRRLFLPPIEPAFPLRGFFFLDWGEALTAERLRPADRLASLRRFRRPETSPSLLLELARLPAWRVERPAGQRSLDGVCRHLLEAALG